MGWRRIGRLVGMTILLYIVPLILLIVLVGSFLVPVTALIVSGSEDPSGTLAAGLGGGMLIFLCLLCGLGIFALALSFIYPFAFRGIVLRDLGVIDSLRHGWQTLKKNLGEVILLALAFFLINIIVLIIAAAILVPVGLVVGVPIAMLGRTDATTLQGILAALGIVVGLVIFALIAAIATAWQSSTFTLAYLQWTGKDVALEA
jgi:hypothetical protein